VSLHSWERFLSDDLAEDAHAVACQRVLVILRAQPGGQITQRELLRLTHWRVAQLNQVAETLCDAGQITIEGRSRLQRVWRLVVKP
jgi:hypothetical protein